jgi:hypothetical protein
MLCEYCSWSEKPDVLKKIKSHVETHHVGLYPKIVWRKGQFVIPLKPKKNEAVYDANIVHHEPAPFPEVVDFTNTSIEETS